MSTRCEGTSCSDYDPNCRSGYCDRYRQDIRAGKDDCPRWK